MITLENVKAIAAEREEAIIWHQKWSPYALNLLEEEYHAIVAGYAQQEGLTLSEVKQILSDSE